MSDLPAYCYPVGTTVPDDWVGSSFEVNVSSAFILVVPGSTAVYDVPVVEYSGSQNSVDLGIKSGKYSVSANTVSHRSAVYGVNAETVSLTGNDITISGYNVKVSSPDVVVGGVSVGNSNMSSDGKLTVGSLESRNIKAGEVSLSSLKVGTMFSADDNSLVYGDFSVTPDGVMTSVGVEADTINTKTLMIENLNVEHTAESLKITGDLFVSDDNGVIFSVTDKVESSVPVMVDGSLTVNGVLTATDTVVDVLVPLTAKGITADSVSTDLLTTGSLEVVNNVTASVGEFSVNSAVSLVRRKGEDIEGTPILTDDYTLNVSSGNVEINGDLVTTGSVETTDLVMPRLLVKDTAGDSHFEVKRETVVENGVPVDKDNIYINGKVLKFNGEITEYVTWPKRVEVPIGVAWSVVEKLPTGEMIYRLGDSYLINGVRFDNVVNYRYVWSESGSTYAVKHGGANGGETESGALTTTILRGSVSFDIEGELTSLIHNTAYTANRKYLCDPLIDVESTESFNHFGLFEKDGKTLVLGVGMVDDNNVRVGEEVYYKPNGVISAGFVWENGTVTGPIENAPMEDVVVGTPEYLLGATSLWIKGPDDKYSLALRRIPTVTYVLDGPVVKGKVLLEDLSVVYLDVLDSSAEADKSDVANEVMNFKYVRASKADIGIVSIDETSMNVNGSMNALQINVIDEFGKVKSSLTSDKLITGHVDTGVVTSDSVLTKRLVVTDTVDLSLVNSEVINIGKVNAPVTAIIGSLKSSTVTAENLESANIKVNNLEVTGTMIADSINPTQPIIVRSNTGTVANPSYTEWMSVDADKVKVTGELRDSSGKIGWPVGSVMFYPEGTGSAFEANSWEKYSGSGNMNVTGTDLDGTTVSFTVPAGLEAWVKVRV